ncbi:transcription factor domain-containing protein [Aspergillus foveolatus]|uniref:transcription factor domain-containing protein n=1 Tax=Aspergillus foveolatus TaxID=210207 RepID=UPI003CCD19B9
MALNTNNLGNTQSASRPSVFEDSDGMTPHREHETAKTQRSPAKRVKRGKYASKACAPCHARKIKCDGHLPCRTCVNKQRVCQRRDIGTSSQFSELSRTVFPGDKERGSGEDKLVQRVNQLESQLQRLLAMNSQLGGLKSPSRPGFVSGAETSSVLSAHKQPITPPDDTAPFVGETSMVHTLYQVEKRFQRIHTTSHSSSSVKSIQPTQSPHPRIRDAPTRLIQSEYLKCVLRAHSVLPDRAQWNRDLQVYVDDVHVLYPILHLPTIRQEFGQFWDQDSTGNTKAQVARILICLAIGRCTTASRAGSEEVQHSSGWSLYSAAMDILGGEAGLFTLNDSTLLILQTITLMIIYLLRLDANERAGKTIAMVVSHSHQLGLHREEVLSKMPIFESEMYRRLWWCVYILDRQVSLETGLPFIIQDINVDTTLPLELTDNWLSRIAGCSKRADSLKAEIEAELSTNPITPIPFLTCMIRYSKVIGKIWEVLYRARSMTADISLGPSTHEYLDHLLTTAERQTPHNLAYNASKSLAEQVSGLDWWQVKQKAILRMRWTFLRLCIRRPILNHTLSGLPSDLDSLDNELKCIKLARSIFDQFCEIPDQYPKFEFPFPHYLARTTMISLGLLIKEPNFRQAYGARTLQMSRDIKSICRKTWVSGKFARSAVALNMMAEAVLGPQSEVSLAQTESAANLAVSSLQGSDSNTAGSNEGDRFHPIDINLSAADKDISASSAHKLSSPYFTVNETENLHVNERSAVRDVNTPSEFLPPASCPPSLSAITESQALANMTPLPSTLADLMTQDFDFEIAFNKDYSRHDTHLSRFATNAGVYFHGGHAENSHPHQGYTVNRTLSPGISVERSSLDATGQPGHSGLDEGGMDWVRDLLGAGFHADSYMMW